MFCDSNIELSHVLLITYSKTCVKRPLWKRPKIGFQHQLSLNAGQTYYRMLQVKHSDVPLTFIKVPIVLKEAKSATMNIFRIFLNFLLNHL